MILSSAPMRVVSSGLMEMSRRRGKVRLMKKLRSDLVGRHRFPDGHYACKVCNVRRVRIGLQEHCIRCARETGILPPARFPQRDAWRRPIGRQVNPKHLKPRPSYARVVDGIEYEVVWSGD